MRITHICRVGWPSLGGMEAVVDGLSAAQAADGHDVRVITLQRSMTTGETLPAGRHRGVRYVRLPRFGPRRYPGALGLLGALRGTDVVHAHGLDALTDGAVHGVWHHGARVGISTHGGFFHTPRHAALKAIWLRTLTRATFRRAGAVWYCSEADRQALAPAGGEGTVVPNGIDVARFSTVVRAPESGRWLVPGRIDIHKGHERLLRVMASLGDAGPRELRIVGPESRPGLMGELAELARVLGIADRVRWLGSASDEDLLQELAHCELALFPSLHEGFGMGAVEAMAAGVPVVLSNIPPYRERVVGGKTGFIVDFDDPDSAGSLLRDLPSSLHAVARAGRQEAQAYAWPQVARLWEQRYDELLG